MRDIPHTEHISRHRDYNGTGKTMYIVVYKNRRLGTARTLIEALMMRDWCVANGWRKFAGGMRYLYFCPTNRLWYIHKDNVHHGCFKRLEDAMHERDCLVQCDWDYDLLVEL